MSTVATIKTTSPIILFDGICNLCNTSVDFIVKRDKHQRLRFLSLQSEKAQQLLHSYKADDSIKTIVLLENGAVYTRSTAALRICRYLRFPWPLLQAFLIIPKFIRDAIYNVISKNRYKWFGRKTGCLIADRPSASFLAEES